MTDFSHLLATGVMRPLGWTLLHFLWQGVALAALGYAMMAVCRSSPVRYLAALTTLLLMFAAPVVTFLLFLHSNGEQGEMAASRQGIAVSQNAGLQNLDLQNQGLQNQGLRNAATPARLSAQPIADRASPDKVVPAGLLLWLVQLWFVGVAFFSLRTAGGFLLIERLRRKQAVPMNVRLRERCLVLQRRLGLDRVIQYCECQWLEYARALTLMEEWRATPSLALAANSSPLAARVARLLGLGKFERQIRSAGIAASFLCLAAALLAGNAFLGVAHAALDAAPKPTIHVQNTGTQDKEIHGPKFQNKNIPNKDVENKLGACALLMAVAHPAPVYQAAEQQSGDWTIRKSDAAGRVDFSLMQHRRGGSSHHESDWPLTAFQGLDISKPGRQEVHFTILRDAGKFECEGYLNNGEGAGLFHFSPDPNYAHAMQSLGFAGVDGGKQLSMAVQDVSLKFAQEMKNEHLKGLDTEKLVAFRIFNVTTDFIHDMRTAGINVSDSEKLVAFRIHGVTPEMVRSLHASGYTPDEDKLIAMRIHGATPEWIEALKKAGYDHVELDKLIAFRIHGVTPEFIEKLQKLGYSHPEPDQLIAMRIHGVSPEYIAGLRSHGMKDLSVDQLVSLRIHGID
jgi:hypothetical protein